jgi:tetratricopeptide (TPR) repeat protein
VEGDRVRVSGLTAVKALNGELARLIFERNKDQHAFYVEESYVLPWMYDFAQPYGIIFRLSNEPLPEFTVGTLMQDRAYWAELSRQLLEDRRYRRDQLAQRTFAKLRANIGSLYAHRGIISEAEHAFRQALQLCPTSAEASYRLAQMYAGVGRTEEALKVLEAYQKHDPFNATMQEAINQIRQNRQPPTVP